jgi:hypothetical protein
MEFYTVMTNSSLLNLGNFDNNDPRIFTVLVIGTEERVQGYIRAQHQTGLAEVNAWSRLLPVPNCPGKVMSILNQTLP